jgi:hypothetical protein
MNDPAAPAAGAVDCSAVIGALCTLHRVPFDAQLLRQRHPPPHALPQVLLSLRELGFFAKARRCTAARLQRQRLPLLARLRDGRFALVLQASHDEVLAWQGEANPQPVPLAQFAEAFTGEVVQARPEVKAPADPDGADAHRAFGFRWFVPELLKHKAVWRRVLLASLFLQLLSLAFPLITQAVVDKVVVHRTQSTLVVLGIAMGIVVVFSALLGWVRQSLVLHTGNRVDAVLGASVFQHLFRLPVSYFERRATGVIAARLHGVETIREFIASAAVTLVLDVPFLFIAVAVMFFYSVTLTLIVLGILALVGVLSLLMAPVFQQRLNRQFLLGARNQAFVTEHVAGHETVKSLQMEPLLNARWGDYLATYLQSGYATRQLGNTYNTVAQALEQLMTVLVLIVGAWIVMHPVPGATAFTIGMLVAFQMTRSPPAAATTPSATTSATASTPSSTAAPPSSAAPWCWALASRRPCCGCRSTAQPWSSPSATPSPAPCASLASAPTTPPPPPPSRSTASPTAPSSPMPSWCSAASTSPAAPPTRPWPAPTSPTASPAAPAATRCAARAAPTPTPSTSAPAATRSPTATPRPAAATRCSSVTASSPPTCARCAPASTRRCSPAATRSR